MEKDEAPHSGTQIDENLLLKESLLKSVAIIEDCRKFMAVSRHALTTNTEIAEALLTFMIARLDPILNNIYSATPDHAFVNSVLEKIKNPNSYDDSTIDFVEIFDEEGNLIASSIFDESRDDG